MTIISDYGQNMDESRYIAAGEFKAKCLKLMDQVQKTKKPIVITKRGKAIAKLSAMDAVEGDFFGCMKDSVKIVGDIIAPIDVTWEANG